MNHKEIDTLWHKALRTAIEKGDDFTRFEFANLVKQHLIESGYRKCVGGQSIKQYCCMVEEAVKEEREACAKVCETLRPSQREFAPRYFDATEHCAAAIRARGEKPYATQAAEVETSTGGRMRVDPLTGAVSIGTAKIKARGKT